MCFCMCLYRVFAYPSNHIEYCHSLNYEDNSFYLPIGQLYSKVSILIYRCLHWTNSSCHSYAPPFSILPLSPHIAEGHPWEYCKKPQILSLVDSCPACNAIKMEIWQIWARNEVKNVNNQYPMVIQQLIVAVNLLLLVLWWCKPRLTCSNAKTVQYPRKYRLRLCSTAIGVSIAWQAVQIIHDLQADAMLHWDYVHLPISFTWYFFLLYVI